MTCHANLEFQICEFILDPNIKRYISSCEKEMTRQTEKMKKTYKGMFEKMAQESEEDLLKEGT